MPTCFRRGVDSVSRYPAGGGCRYGRHRAFSGIRHTGRPNRRHSGWANGPTRSRVAAQHTERPKRWRPAPPTPGTGRLYASSAPCKGVQVGKVYYLGAERRVSGARLRQDAPEIGPELDQIGRVVGRDVCALCARTSLTEPPLTAGADTDRVTIMGLTGKNGADRYSVTRPTCYPSRS